MIVGNFSAQIKAQSRPLCLAGRLLPAPVKLAKDLFLFLFGDTGTFVFYGQQDMPALRYKGKGNGALFREIFEGIFQQGCSPGALQKEGISGDGTAGLNVGRPFSFGKATAIIPDGSFRQFGKVHHLFCPVISAAFEL